MIIRIGATYFGKFLYIKKLGVYRQGDKPPQTASKRKLEVYIIQFLK